MMRRVMPHASTWLSAGGKLYCNRSDELGVAGHFRSAFVGVGVLELLGASFIGPVLTDAFVCERDLAGVVRRWLRLSQVHCRVAPVNLHWF
jgi:hypothetical protein